MSYKDLIKKFQVRMERDTTSRDTYVWATMPDQVVAEAMEYKILEEVSYAIGKKIADEYVKNNRKTLLKKISSDAIVKNALIQSTELVEEMVNKALKKKP